MYVCVYGQLNPPHTYTAPFSHYALSHSLKTPE